MTIPDEAVEAAARALHALTSHFDGECDIQEHWTAWVDDARAALTAAAPLIAAQATAQIERDYMTRSRTAGEYLQEMNRLRVEIEALRDEWRGFGLPGQGDRFYAGYSKACRDHADALDALLREGE